MIGQGGAAVSPPRVLPWGAVAAARSVALLCAVSCGSTTGAPQGTGGGSAAGTGGEKADAGPPGDGTGGLPPGSGGAPGAASGGTTMPGTGGSGTGSGGTSASGGGPGAAGSGGAGTGGTETGTGGAASGGEAGGRGGHSGRGGGAGGLQGGGRGGAAGDGGTASGCDFSSADGKIVLFDGTSLAGWQNTATGGAAQWRLVGDGSMEVVAMNPSTNIQTTMKFDDLCLHVEYMTPMYPANITGQQRGNSGIYFRRAYETQVLDSYGQPPLLDGCGAIYDISPPLVVACNMQLVWNTYEIEFRASQWDSSRKKTKDAVFALVTLNGQVVQRNVDLNVSMTTSGQPDAPGPQPFMLQDHGNAVRYRNIWAKIPH
jgi:hypothetical protein